MKKLGEMEGWVSIHRQLSENPLWTCEPFSRGQAWVDLILLASHKRSYFYKRGVKIDVERGSLAWSEKALSERWKWSRSKVRKFLNDLEKEQQIVLQKSNVTQVVTVKNYDKYQQKEPQTVPQKDTKRTPKEPQKDTYNNENNENNEKEEFGKPTSEIPTIEKCLEYFKTRTTAKFEAKNFFDYYEAAKWQNELGKIVNWQQKAISWIGRIEKRQEQPTTRKYKEL